MGSQNIAIFCVYGIVEHSVETDCQRKYLVHPSCQPKKNLLPPLNVTLGLMKHFVKTIDKDEGFKHLRKLFLQLSEAKYKGVVFTVPNIRKLTGDPAFKGKLNQKEPTAWKSYLKGVKGFLR